MRTTVEIKPQHRAKLLEIAAQRGEKGFSSVIAEALDAYLRGEAERDRKLRLALAQRGKLTPQAAKRLRARVAEVRKFWR